MSKKTIDKKEFLKAINRDIKIMCKDLEDSLPDAYSYNAGQLSAFDWVKRWVEADLGDV